MLKIIVISLLACILFAGCACGCQNDGPAIEKTETPAAEAPNAATSATEIVPATKSDVNVTDCGCGNK